MSRALFWFRRDLRRVDNVGLHRARREHDDLHGVYVVDPTHTNWPHRCGDRFAFAMDCLRDLREAFRGDGGELLVRRGDAAGVLGSLVGELDVDAVHWNRAYEPYERERDGRAREALEEAGVEVHTHKDQVLFEREEILTQQGDPYQVFTYYARRWKNRPKPGSVDPVENLRKPPDVKPGSIPGPGDLDLETHLGEHPVPPTREAARSRLESFVAEDLLEYDTHRDYPAREGTSRLSPYLRFGVLSAREVYEICRSRWRDDARTDGIETFVEELIWRDFYHQVLYNYPRCASKNFKSKFDEVNWEEPGDELEAWKRGDTGFPIVDAAMRQLNQTGWMHNRLRMIVAVFLTKDCLIHWRHGEKYFMNRLVDGDTAANNGGWQWSASTGTDAVPYFRIFNPWTQGKRYDPDGEFIARFCPELAGLDPADRHRPDRADPRSLDDAGVERGETYPEPMLDHDRRRERTLAEFERVTSD